MRLYQSSWLGNELFKLYCSICSILLLLPILVLGSLLTGMCSSAESSRGILGSSLKCSPLWTVCLSVLLVPVNSSHLDLLEPSTVSSIQGDFWALLGFPFLCGAWKLFQGSKPGKLPSSPRSLSGAAYGPISENCYIIYFVSFVSYFRQEGTSSPCYSVVAGSGSLLALS